MTNAQDYEIEVRDNRNLQALVGSYEPLALKLIHETTADLPAAFARRVMGLYWALIELTNMNGSGHIISREFLERFSRISPRWQKEPRDFLVKIGLLEVHAVSFDGSGARKRLSYTLLRAPRMAKNASIQQAEMRGADGQNVLREKVPNEAPSKSFPQGPTDKMSPNKGFKDKLKDTSYLAAAPREAHLNDENLTATLTDSEDDGWLENFLAEDGDPYADEEEKSTALVAEKMKAMLIERRAELTRKQMVGYLTAILLDGASNRERLSRPDGRPRPEVYRQVGILLSRFPLEFLIEVFSRWDSVPLRDGGVSLIAPATSVYPLWAADRSAAEAEALKSEGTVLSSEELRTALEGHYA